jgi:hypothetical protein
MVYSKAKSEPTPQKKRSYELSMKANISDDVKKLNLQLSKLVELKTLMLKNKPRYKK